jgi:hypothetical protein
VETEDVVRRLTRSIDNIDPNRWYSNREQIACASATLVVQNINHLARRSGGNVWICAFLQNTAGAPGSKILELAHRIDAHGCTVCGSVPYFYPAENDVSRGELTYNYVNKPCSRRDGLCSTTSSSAVGTLDNSCMCTFQVCILIYFRLTHSASTQSTQTLFHALSHCFV